MAYRVHGRSSGSTLSATELLHEAWLKVERSSSTINDPAHYVRVAARAMRQILVDHARSRQTERRGGDRVRTTLSHQGEPAVALDLIIFDDLLTELSEGYERVGQVVELRVFGGLTPAEIAELLSVSSRTVSMDWRFARAFLESRLAED